MVSLIEPYLQQRQLQSIKVSTIQQIREALLTVMYTGMLLLPAHFTLRWSHICWL